MTDTNNDFELVKSFIAGNEAAFNKIVLKYQQKIYWHARRMTGNHLDADEVVQEVLIVLYNKLKGFQFKSSLYTWIYKITSTRSINYLKKRSLKQIFSLDDNETKAVRSNDDIIKDIETKEKLDKLEKALQKIPPRQREVFVMRNFDEMSYEEISEITGITTGGLKANYFHAMKKIMEIMQYNENG
ncbi:MAG: RNA polymerase sigma factor [Ignavibacteriaceae bacterium]